MTGYLFAIFFFVFSLLRTFGNLDGKLAQKEIKKEKKQRNQELKLRKKQHKMSKYDLKEKEAMMKLEEDRWYRHEKYALKIENERKKQEDRAAAKKELTAEVKGIAMQYVKPAKVILWIVKLPFKILKKKRKKKAAKRIEVKNVASIE